MSKKPGKERKAQFELQMHIAAKQVASPLDEKLQKELGVKSMPVRKGDVVKIVRGSNKGKEGKIIEVDRKARKIFVEKIIRKKSNGEEIQVPIDASKVIVIDVDRADRKRFAKKKESEKK
jgi:large subunit ribosomal protein L24